MTATRINWEKTSFVILREYRANYNFQFSNEHTRRGNSSRYYLVMQRTSKNRRAEPAAT